MTSRNPTSRPRKVAGQRAEPDGGFETGLRPSSTTDDHADPVVEPVETPEADPVVEEGAPAPVSRPPSRKRTVALVAAIVVLLGIGIAEIVYLNQDDAATISADRPVVTGELTHRAAVDAAASSAVEILSTSYDDYDAQVEQATSKMTDSFAEDYRGTADGIKEAFVENETKLQFEAVGQSVVQASPEQVQALLFLNQYVEKVVDGEPRTDYAQYRALVTVVHTDHGWLVSDIETQ
ncbi:hypothetical protein [Nocardioides sp. SR21]|uniref:hypothetical protein n=1 Tax=Nocardioides sp. SR21 TaxID=2919501 RepID=UPI001FAB2564|nr:hypothetical protein [Nocardioides sp. SR21]